MSRFAAIEARATQYPASTNDVVWLVEKVRELRYAVERSYAAMDAVRRGDVLLSTDSALLLTSRMQDIAIALAEVK